MARFSYSKHIDSFTPEEVFKAASLVSSLPTRRVSGFRLDVLDDAERFDLGVGVQATVAFGPFSYDIPGQITRFEPPETVEVQAQTVLGEASLLLAVSTNDQEDGTDIDCTLDTRPSLIGQGIEWALNPFLRRTMPNYAALYSDSVVATLRGS